VAAFLCVFSFSFFFRLNYVYDRTPIFFFVKWKKKDSRGKDVKKLFSFDVYVSFYFLRRPNFKLPLLPTFLSNTKKEASGILMIVNGHIK
jgi:hypothetical protein